MDLAKKAADAEAAAQVLIAFRLQSEFGQHRADQLLRRIPRLNRLSASVRIWTALPSSFSTAHTPCLNRLSASVRIWTSVPSCYIAYKCVVS